MGEIRILPDGIINQIAAGEVVERPSSVVKELLENAIDAGATQITVTLNDGGKELISVLDNGRGMDEADVRLACRRHATSKVCGTVEEAAATLSTLETLGFRGEALASIASVSRFVLTSCTDEQAGGTRIVIEGGEERSVGRVGFPQGTKVSVENLFYNTPARRKFLRTAATEFQQIQGVFVNVALGHPALRLRLRHNGRTVYSLSPCQELRERVRQVFGTELGEGLVPVSGREGTVAWEGLISLPSHSRASRRWQYLFLNRRPIQHSSLSHGIYQAYRTQLMKGRHPAYVLVLHVDPAAVDVNVHPAKTEVRLRNAQVVHTVLADRLYRALLESSRAAALGPRVGVLAAPSPVLGVGEPQLELGLRRGGRPGADRLAGLSYPNAVRDQAGQAGPLPGEGMTRGEEGGADLHTNPLDGGGFGFQPVAISLPEAERQALGGSELGCNDGLGGGGLGDNGPAGGLSSDRLGGKGWGEQATGGVAGLQPAGAWAAAAGTVLAQLAGTYVLVHRDDALLIVDQHAAHERILFEQLRVQFYRGQMQTEHYLVPETVELSPQNALLLEQYLPQWRRLGFEIQPFGRNVFRITEVPALLTGKASSTLLLEVLDELALFGKSGRIEEVFNEIMERVACHGAVRAGDRLAVEEMEALVAQLAGLDVSVHCPHGRPVWVEISQHELERRFRRSV